MRILYTVQRYGEEIVGGSEAACRMFAEQLAARGHQVEVLTSCARRYTDWADEYPPGSTTINGVTVHRLPVVAERSHAEFAPLNDWTIHGPWPVPLAQQRRWAEVMGPRLQGQRRWLSERAASFDAVIHMTYLYSTTTSGLPVTAGRVPTILQPTAHDEPALWVRHLDTLFRLADAFLYFTPEEREIVERRFAMPTAGRVAGIGMELFERADPSALRQRLGLSTAPYLVYVGRIDPAKGAVEAWKFFDAYKRRRPGPLKLVMVGDPVVDLPAHPDVIFAGFLDEADKRAALSGSLALLQPSYFESFSIVLCESWLQCRPALVQGASEVLAGQARRSSGALAYRGFAEFEAALDLLTDRPQLADAMGSSGRDYVVRTYAWDTVIAQVEQTIELARDRHHSRAGQRFSAAGVHATRA